MSNTRTEECNSWGDFNSAIETLRNAAPHASFLFRGHARSEWALRSSLGRIALAAKIDDLKAVKIEKRLLDNFLRHAHLLLPASLLGDDSDLIHWWSVMQHFGAPTRLLDWTLSPFVALYFTVVEAIGEDGAVWAIPVNGAHEIGVAPEEKNWFRQRDFFWDTRVAVDFRIVHSRRPSERMNAQQSVFTVTNAIIPQHEQMVQHLSASHTTTDIVKLVVRANAKVDILKRLQEMNVHASSLFPGVAGVGAMTRDLATVLMNLE